MARRALSDLSMMIDTTFGPYPTPAPWFSTPFGRDGLITALECLWAAPALARGVLSYLASTQATRTDPISDAQPGKILHEARDGEMASLGEIPFGRYYGSHDATPLFVVLASAYYDRTGDRATIERIWPNVEAALAWIERDGDLDGDGFIEYLRQSPTGLVQQGWKDSPIVLHRTAGRQKAVAPARSGTCRVARGSRLAVCSGTSVSLTRCCQGRSDQGSFRRRVLVPDIGTYASRWTAGNSGARSSLRTPAMRTPASQARATPARAVAHVGGELRDGGRTGRPQSALQPDVLPQRLDWPHDNAIVAAGLSRYEFRDEALLVMNGMFEASLAMELHRLPELFCGFSRRSGEVPTLYPVACAPQAWASGAVFLLLQGLLGLEVDAATRLVRFTRSRLPSFLNEVL
jgi:glycogen debranching enzyme